MSTIRVTRNGLVRGKPRNMLSSSALKTAYCGTGDIDSAIKQVEDDIDADLLRKGLSVADLSTDTKKLDFYACMLLMSISKDAKPLSVYGSSNELSLYSKNTGIEAVRGEVYVNNCAMYVFADSSKLYTGFNKAWLIGENLSSDSFIPVVAYGTMVDADTYVKEPRYDTFYFGIQYIGEALMGVPTCRHRDYFEQVFVNTKSSISDDFEARKHKSSVYSSMLSFVCARVIYFYQELISSYARNEVLNGKYSGGALWYGGKVYDVSKSCLTTLISVQRYETVYTEVIAVFDMERNLPDILIFPECGFMIYKDLYSGEYNAELLHEDRSVESKKKLLL